MPSSAQKAERDAFVGASYQHLVIERTPGALAAAEGLERALQAVLEAARAWEGEASEQLALRTVARPGGTDAVPRLGMEDLLLQVKRRAPQGVVAPLPRELAPVRTPATPSPRIAA